MPTYNVTVSYTYVLTTEADDEADAEAQGESLDITEVYDNLSGQAVVNVEEVTE